LLPEFNIKIPIGESTLNQPGLPSIVLSVIHIALQLFL
jgi:hypothetical protein